MKFARIVFVAGGVWGIAVLVPFYWLVDITGRHYAAPTDYPQFFWGFFSVALAWQFAFLLIGSNPVRFRPLMVPAIVEKFGFIMTLAAAWPRTYPERRRRGCHPRRDRGPLVRRCVRRNLV